MEACVVKALGSLCYYIYAVNKEAKVVIDLFGWSYMPSKFYDDDFNACLQ